VASAQERGIGSDKGPYSCLEEGQTRGPAVQGSDEASACCTAPGRVEKSSGRSAVVARMAGAQGGVGAGDIAAAAGAVVAADPRSTADCCLDIRLEGPDCRGFADPLGAALQDRERCAGRRVLGGVDHSR
jgi:hypothetical protein